MWDKELCICNTTLSSRIRNVVLIWHPVSNGIYNIIEFHKLQPCRNLSFSCFFNGYRKIILHGSPLCGKYIHYNIWSNFRDDHCLFCEYVDPVEYMESVMGGQLLLYNKSFGADFVRLWPVRITASRGGVQRSDVHPLVLPLHAAGYVRGISVCCQDSNQYYSNVLTQPTFQSSYDYALVHQRWVRAISLWNFNDLHFCLHLHVNCRISSGLRMAHEDEVDDCGLSKKPNAAAVRNLRKYLSMRGCIVRAQMWELRQ